MIHFFEDNKSDKILVLLHGTGGNEYSLYDIAKMINKDISILGIRGSYQEGVSRYCKPLNNERKFDMEDMDFRSEEIIQFLESHSRDNKYLLENIVFIAYSNGANILFNIIRKDKRFKNAVLLHPMFPNEVNDFVVNQELKVLLSIGLNDDIVTKEESQDIIEKINKITNNVDIIYTKNHFIEMKEIEGIKKFLKLV